MITEELIYKLTEEALEGSDYFVVDVIVKKSELIMVFLDSDTSVSIDKCIEVSRFIEGNLNRDEEDFELRVSSSGLDHPLTMPRQMKKYIGKNLDIELQDGSKFRCKLLEVNELGLSVELILVKKINKMKKEEPAGKMEYTFEQAKIVRPVINFG